MVNTIPQKWKTPQVKFSVLAILTVFIVLLTLFSLFNNVQVLFTHVYYLPIILASFWYQRKGVVYTVVLALFYLAAVFTLLSITTEVLFVSVGRALVFLLISLVICLLSRAISRQQEEIMESEKKIRTVWEHIQAGIIIVDAQTHQIISANPEAERLTGYKESEMVGHICHQFICPAERGKCPIGDLHQKVDRSERFLLNRNGEKVPVLKTATVTNLGGRMVHIENFVPLPEPKGP